MNKDYIKSLDGFRGFAAIVVLYGHSPSILGESFLTQLPVAAKSGVYLFFILSAYLLGHQFMTTQFTRNNLFSNLETYARRRVFRILPLYFFAVLVHYLVTLLVPGVSLVIMDFQA